jgi:hypothetical protein
MVLTGFSWLGIGSNGGRDLMNAVKNIGVSKFGMLPDLLSHYQLLKEDWSVRLCSSCWQWSVQFWTLTTYLCHFSQVWLTSRVACCVCLGALGLQVTLDFTEEPRDVVAVRGKPLVLQCAVSSSVPGPVNISWTHDGELVSDSRRRLLSNGSLYFKKVSADFRVCAVWSKPEGDVACYIKNSFLI